MSDVAEAWAKAQDCIDEKGRFDRNAKDVLKTLATWADAEGEVWAAVPVLAMECHCSDRTVQRGLRALKAYGLLKETGRTTLRYGRVYPIYRMPLEEGHANTIRRLKAERAVTRGDAHVTPSAPDGVTPMSPQGDAHVTPRGDTHVTQIGKEDSQGLKPSAGVREREAAKRLWATRAPERVAEGPVDRAWAQAVDRTGVSGERLLAAVKAAVARDPDFGRGKAMNLDRWLDEGRFLAWLPEDGAMPVTPPEHGWSGPATVRQAVVEAMGETAAASYLDPAGWDEGLGAIVAATRIAADRLTQGAGRALKGLGVQVTQGAVRG